MTVEELKEKIMNEQHIDEDSFKIINKQKLAFVIDKNSVQSVLSYLKGLGFLQLSLITCVDWLKDNKFEIVYNLVSWELRLDITLKTFIDRNNPEINTIHTIFPAAIYYERDIWEFFGVNFKGNNELKPLYLEDWDDIPPMRKDFDPQAYSDKKFGEREYKFEIHPKKVIE